MISISARYDGELRCEATHGPTGVRLSTDAPTDNEGRGESFSPTDLVATALATCAITTMGIVVRREQIPIGGMEVSVEKHMVADPLRRIGRLPVRITVSGRPDAQQREKLERAARSCPVAESIRREIEAPMTFVYPDLDGA